MIRLRSLHSLVMWASLLMITDIWFVSAVAIKVASKERLFSSFPSLFARKKLVVRLGVASFAGLF